MTVEDIPRAVARGHAEAIERAIARAIVDYRLNSPRDLLLKVHAPRGGLAAHSVVALPRGDGESLDLWQVVTWFSGTTAVTTTAPGYHTVDDIMKRRLNIDAALAMASTSPAELVRGVETSLLHRNLSPSGGLALVSEVADGWCHTVAFEGGLWAGMESVRYTTGRDAGVMVLEEVDLERGRLRFVPPPKAGDEIYFAP